MHAQARLRVITTHRRQGFVWLFFGARALNCGAGGPGSGGSLLGLDRFVWKVYELNDCSAGPFVTVHGRGTGVGRDEQSHPPSSARWAAVLVSATTLAGLATSAQAAPLGRARRASASGWPSPISRLQPIPGPATYRTWAPPAGRCRAARSPPRPARRSPHPGFSTSSWLPVSQRRRGRARHRDRGAAAERHLPGRHRSAAGEPEHQRPEQRLLLDNMQPCFGS